MSKHVTFILGNGFDINVGLNTRYTDFYKVYTRDNSASSNVLEKFKKDILKAEAHGWKNWADFETGLGRYSTHFGGDTPVEDFIECFTDFVVCFNKYLIEQCDRIDWDAVNEAFCRNFVLSVRQFYSHIKTVQQKSVQELLQHNYQVKAKVNFLQFNYTNAFDELIKRSNLSALLNKLGAQGTQISQMGVNLHVHGYMDKGYPTIGVNDETQIENEKIRNDPRIHKIFIKPKFLDALQKRDVNRNIPRVQALAAIAESTVICAFGASMGESDKYWWIKIGDWLKKTPGFFVIFDICGSQDDGISPTLFLDSEMSVDERRKEIIGRFCTLSGLDTEWLRSNPYKILVEFDTNLFSFNLPMKNALNEDIDQSREK